MSTPRPGIDVNAFLRHTKAFGDLPDALIADLARSAMIERFVSRSLIQAAGEVVEKFRLVVTGHLEVISRLPSGDEVELYEVVPGQGFPWLPCISKAVPVYDIWTSAHSSVITLPAEQVRTVCRAYPAIYQHILVEVSERVGWLMEWTTQSVLLKPEQRLAKLLHVLARSRGTDGHTANLPLTQARLARLAGCSRQSLNLLLKALKQRGLVTGAYGQLCISDMRELDAFTVSTAP